MRNRIKQFFGWLMSGVKSLWQMGWRKVMDFVTNLEEVNQVLDRLEVQAQPEVSKLSRAWSYVAGFTHSFTKRWFVKTSACQGLDKTCQGLDKEQKMLSINIPKFSMRGKKHRFKPLVMA